MLQPPLEIVVIGNKTVPRKGADAISTLALDCCSVWQPDVWCRVVAVDNVVPSTGRLSWKSHAGATAKLSLQHPRYRCTACMLAGTEHQGLRTLGWSCQAWAKAGLVTMHAHCTAAAAKAGVGQLALLLAMRC
jgi:hypothetical protein